MFAVLWFTALLLMVPGGQAEECSCAPQGPPCDAFWRADTVFSGTVIAIAAEQRPPAQKRGSAAGPPPPPLPPFGWLPTKVTIATDHVWRGQAAGDVVVYTGEPDSGCGFEFEIGKKYLVYAMHRHAMLQTSQCSRTKLFTDARPDLDYFEELKQPAFGGSIIGRARLGASPAATFKVSIGNESGTWSSVTDANGEFAFTNRAPGRYAIGIDVPEHYRLTAGAKLLELRDTRGCAFTEFGITAVGAVSLTVLDAAGKPAVRTTLELIEAETLRDERPRGHPQRTYADGSVAWANVAPGRYVIGMNVTTLANPMRGRGRLFYPGVTDLASAFEFSVGVGERVELDTLRLPALPTRVDVSGVVFRADGTPLRGADILLRSAEESSRGHLVGRAVRTDAEGRFSIPALAGESYFLDVWLGVEGVLKDRFTQTDDFRVRAGMKPLAISQ
jgi:hypothetical protein